MYCVQTGQGEAKYRKTDFKTFVLKISGYGSGLGFALTNQWFCGGGQEVTRQLGVRSSNQERIWANRDTKADICSSWTQLGS